MSDSPSTPKKRGRPRKIAVQPARRPVMPENIEVEMLERTFLPRLILTIRKHRPASVSALTTAFENDHAWTIPINRMRTWLQALGVKLENSPRWSRHSNGIHEFLLGNAPGEQMELWPDEPDEPDEQTQAPDDETADEGGVPIVRMGPQREPRRTLPGIPNPFSG